MAVLGRPRMLNQLEPERPLMAPLPLLLVLPRLSC
jgi:hypothetical protein